MNLMAQFRSLYLTYCANHPSAVSVLTQHRWVMEDMAFAPGVANGVRRQHGILLPEKLLRVWAFHLPLSALA